MFLEGLSDEVKMSLAQVVSRNSKRVLQVEMEDGSWWNVPVSVVADDKASRLIEISGERDVQFYIDVFSDTVDDSDAIIKWAEERMSWDDVRDVAVQVRSPRDATYSSSWRDGMKTVVDT